MTDFYPAVHGCTTVFRKGEEVETREVNGLKVTEIFGYPLAPEGVDVQDLVFVSVAVDKEKAEASWLVIEVALRAYPDPARLAGGLSYIELAPSLEVEQETVLRLMAVGAALGKWTIVSGKTVGMDDDTARTLAGTGFLMISGWRP